MPPAGPASSPARAIWDVSEQGQALLAVLFPHLAGLRVHRVEDVTDAVIIVASCRAEAACCPRCGQQSARVHGGYSRMVADGAAGGRPVLILLLVRRFRCRNPACPAVTFAEQAAGVSVRYRRRSVPLLGMLAGFGLELAGRAATRLAGTLGIAVHSSTVLRLVMALPDPPVTAAPQVTGVDDFALRKGHVYGTVVADAQSGDVIDLLPDREAGTLEEWLKAHPGAEVICRDRAGAYAEGARDGAPGAIQVADRWHLWHNLAEYAGKTVTRHRGCLKDQPAAGETGDKDAPGPADTPGPEQAEAAPVTQDGSLDVCGRERQMARRTRERYAEIRERLDAGQPQAAIRRATGLDRRTVQKYARAASADELVASMSRDSKLDEYKPYICQRWNQGLTEAAQIHAELAQRGWTGSPQTVRRYVHLLRKTGPAVTPAPAVPKTREITRWLLSRPASLDDGDQARLAAVRARCPHLDSLAGHIRDFAEMMTRRQGLLALEDWLTRVEADDQPDLHSLAAGIRRDQDAVTAGLALPYSSAAMEGNVNKIKMIKRQMYGRAGFALLRKRVILHPALPGSQNSRKSRSR
jgi:transposase